LAQHPIGFASSRRELANQVLGGTEVHRDRASRLLPCVGRGDGRGRHAHSSDTISFFAWIAASSVCHARLAHFTRTGNSHTPERTASLPRDPVSMGSPGRPVTILRNFSNNSCACALDFPFTASVIREAEAFEIAHPWPTKPTSAPFGNRERISWSSLIRIGGTFTWFTTSEANAYVRMCRAFSSSIPRERR